jgi:hypothetical protein
MRRSGIATVLMLLAPSVMAGWGEPCNTTLTLEPTFGRISSIARCSYNFGSTQDTSVLINISHSVSPGGPGQTDVCQGSGYCGTSVLVSPYAASTTYTSTANISVSRLGYTFDRRPETFSLTTPDPERPRSVTVCDDGSATGQCSPIVINVESGPYRLSGFDDPVQFDMNADGVTDRITWTARDGATAFLAIDRNQNLRIDDGSELFGNWTVLPSGTRASNGFEALIAFDDNGDGVIDAADAVWHSLLLWTDANHDGKSQPEELENIALNPIRAIETAYRRVARTDPAGNLFRYKGTAHFERGERAIYDVYFRSVP